MSHRECSDAPESSDRMAWIRAHQASVWRYLRWLGASPTVADDLTQDTFLLALQKQLENRGHDRARSFLRRTAKNFWLRAQRDQRRAAAVAREVDVLWARAAWSPVVGEDEDDGVVLREALRGCLAKLQGRAADAVRLCYRECMGREEIAQELGLRPEGVKTLLRRTRQQIRTCIEQETKS